MDHVPGCVFDAKLQLVRNPGAKGLRTAIPDHAIAIGQGRHSRIEVRFFEGWSRACCVVTFERRAGDLGQLDFGGGRLREPVFVDDIAVKRIPAARHRGQGLREGGCAGAVGMQVPDEIHAGNANHIKVHEVPMIGEQVVGLPGQPAGIVQMKLQLVAALQFGFQAQGLVDTQLVIPGF